MPGSMTIGEAIANATQQALVLERAAEHWEGINPNLQSDILERLDALMLVISYAELQQKAEETANNSPQKEQIS